MPLDPINVGSAPNDNTGDPLRTAFIKINDMMAELYAAMVNAVVDCGAADLSGGSMPTVGGTGPAGAIRKGNQFDVSVGGTISGWSESIPTGSIIRAKVDDPADIEVNWKAARV